MIQRIQTIFLLLASAATFSLYKLPFASAGKSDITPFLSDGIFNVMDHPGFLGLFGLGGLLLLLAIFMFKNRILQMRVTLFASVLVLLGLILIPVLLFQAGNVVIQMLQVKVGMFIPALAVIFGLLARRAIRKDEKLVKSMDRLR